MADLKGRFDALGRTRAPDLWSEIELRRPGASIDPDPAPAHRAAIVALALIISVTAIAFTIRAFQRAEVPAVTTPSPRLQENGDLYFAVGGGEVGVAYEAVSPDGSHRRTILPVDHAHVGWPQFGDLAWSPDGTQIAFVSWLAGHTGIFTANADGSDITRLDPDPKASWPTWSPDGSQIGFSSARADSTLESCPGGDFSAGGTCPSDIYVMNADGSGVQRLTTDAAPEFGPVWSPDGSQISFWRQGEGSDFLTNIAVMNADGSGVREVASAPHGSDFRPSWSPDGSSIVYASIRNETWGIYVTDLATGQERRLAPATPATVDDPVWSPDGTQIAYSSDSDLMVMNADGSDPHRVAHDPSEVGIDNITWRARSDDVVQLARGATPPRGSIVFTAVDGRFGSELAYTTLDAPAATFMTDAASENRVAGGAAWSPDGTQLAFVLGDRDSWRFTGDGALYVMNADGSGLRQLPVSAVTSPTWSPNGSSIAFVSDQGTSLQAINLDGSGLRVIAAARGYYQVPRWSPDGALIAYQSRVSAGSERTAIFTIRPDGTQERLVTPPDVNAGSPTWSPDGRELAYSGSGEELVALNLATGQERSLTTCHLPCVGDSAPAWSPDGQHIAFSRQEEGGATVHLYVLDLSEGVVIRIATSLDAAAAPTWRP